MDDKIRISATQIDTYRRCPRKWAWDKLDKVPRTPNKFAELGSAVHEVLENWLRDGTPIDPNTDVGRIAMAGLQHLPEPKTGTVEGRFEYGFEGEDWIFLGYIDWQDETTVLDHKTTGNFRWAKKPEDLLSDVQATIYAGKKFAESADLGTVQLRWIYYRTKGAAKSRAVEITVAREATERRLLPIVDTARAIVDARRTKTTATELEPDARECDSFGGCPYISRCKLTSSDRMKALMSQHSLAEKMEQENKMGMSLAEKIKAKKAAQQSGGVNPPPAEKQEAPAAAEKPAAEKPAAEKPAAVTTTTAAKPVQESDIVVGLDSDVFVRDRFAMSALSGLLSARTISIQNTDELASEAYNLADAMMKARSR